MPRCCVAVRNNRKQGRPLKPLHEDTIAVTAGKRADNAFGYAGTEDWNNIKTDLNMQRTLWESYTQKLVRAPLRPRALQQHREYREYATVHRRLGTLRHRSTPKRTTSGGWARPSRSCSAWSKGATTRALIRSRRLFLRAVLFVRLFGAGFVCLFAPIGPLSFVLCCARRRRWLAVRHTYCGSAGSALGGVAEKMKNQPLVHRGFQKAYHTVCDEVAAHSCACPNPYCDCP